MSDAIGVLRWGLRHYAVLFVATVIGVAVLVPLIIAQGAPRYQASALVVAQRLDMDLTALPRYAEATFGNGEVARAVQTRLAGTASSGNVIPDLVSLRADQDSIVLQVYGWDRSADGAAELANTAAAAFVAQLNLPGVGVGKFSVQSAATPPAKPVPQLAGAPVALAVGLAAGTVLGLALVSLLLVLRRPVLDAADAAEITGVPVMGTVTMPRLRARDQLQPADIGGLIPVCRRLLAMHPAAVLLMGTGRSQTARQLLCVALARVLGRVLPVSLVADSAVCAAAQGFPGEDVIPADATDPPQPAGPGSGITLIDGPRPLDVVAPAPSTVAVLVVAQGTPERVLRATVSEQLGGLASDRLLMLRREGRPRPGAVPARSEMTTRSAPSGVGTAPN